MSAVMIFQKMMPKAQAKSSMQIQIDYRSDARLYYPVIPGSTVVSLYLNIPQWDNDKSFRNKKGTLLILFIKSFYKLRIDKTF